MHAKSEERRAEQPSELQADLPGTATCAPRLAKDSPQSPSAMQNERYPACLWHSKPDMPGISVGIPTLIPGISAKGCHKQATWMNAGIESVPNKGKYSAIRMVSSEKPDHTLTAQADRHGLEQPTRMQIQEQRRLQHNEHGQAPYEIPIPGLVLEQPHGDNAADGAAHERQPHQP